MRTISITILVLFALFTGGCSLLFLFASLFDARPGDSLSYIALPAGVGLILCFLTTLLIRRVTREPANQPPPATSKATDKKDNWG